MKIRNALPYSESNNPNEFYQLTEQQQTTLCIWIEECLKPHETKGYYPHHNSYGLKHRFESSNYGFYISNGAFKGGMREMDFMPKEKNTLNWTFKLGKRAAENNDIYIPAV